MKGSIIILDVNCLLLDITVCRRYQLIFFLSGVSSSSLSSLSSLARHLFGLCWYKQLRIPFLMLMKSWWGGYTIWSTSSPHFTKCSNIPSKSTLDAQLLMSCEFVWKLNNKTSIEVLSHLLYQLYTSVQLLAITPLVLKGGAGKFLVIFGAFHKLWEVILAGPVQFFFFAGSN